MKCLAFRIHRLRVGFRAASLILIVAIVGGSFQPVAAQPEDPRFFPQTNFRVETDSFWTFFQSRGGVRTFGYPVSRTFSLDGFPVQIFQRIVMQLQPDGSVSTLNLLDAGLLPYTRVNGSTFPSPDLALIAQTPLPNDPQYAAKIVDFVQAVAPDTFDGNAVNFGSTFNSSVTGADAPDAPESLLPLFNLQIWGAPTSAPAYDPANQNFIYQRFQRGIMHYDKTCDCTQGLLLADYLKSLLTGTNLPPDLAAQARADNSRFLNQYAPGQPRSIARPADLLGSDLTNAFEPQQPGAQTALPSASSASLTAQNQADFLVRALEKARSLDYVAGMMVWNLNYQLAVPQTDEKWGFSVLRDDWTGRPAYYALAEMAKR